MAALLPAGTLQSLQHTKVVKSKPDLAVGDVYWVRFFDVDADYAWVLAPYCGTDEYGDPRFINAMAFVMSSEYVGREFSIGNMKANGKSRVRKPLA